ncbi:hypothetical protein VIBNISO65_1530036 [Vibrio nigripulchritudo SO65]|nr:hypothetical protein VIBNIPon4_570048 [Vibrio nigripulchritudo POn4]CCN76186.1 hypothetical protein VIBNISO65_1530036 [Vibrio nigripulchritudo SO65]
MISLMVYRMIKLHSIYTLHWSELTYSHDHCYHKHIGLAPPDPLVSANLLHEKQKASFGCCHFSLLQ